MHQSIGAFTLIDLSAGWNSIIFSSGELRGEKQGEENAARFYPCKTKVGYQAVL